MEKKIGNEDLEANTKIMALGVSAPAEEEQAEGPRKGGLRTMPFIIVNESFEKMASYGLMPNMIFYLMKKYHMETVDGTTILFVWNAVSNALAMVGAFVSDSYFGRFSIITFGSIFTLLGMTLLWLTAMIPELRPPSCVDYSPSCVSASSGQVCVLLVSFILMAIGTGCIRPCSIAFGADQLQKKDDPNRQRILESYFNWYYASIGIATIMAFTILVYIQDHLGWKLGFGIPTVLMLIATMIFVFGAPLYIKLKPGKSFFTDIVQAFVAAFRKKGAPLPSNEIEYYKGEDSNYIVPSDKLRFFNKACIIINAEEELNEDGSASNPWKLCTISQVEALKSVLRIIPMWSTGITIVLCMGQQSYATLQANIMDRHLISSFEIPAGSFSVFTVLTITIWVPIYDRLIIPFLSKFTGKPKGIGARTRMGIGLVISAVAMAVSAIVENIRRNNAINQGLADKRGAVMDMSAMWLIPQHALFGFAEAFNAIGQIEFYYSQLPKGMSSFAMALFTLGQAVSSLLGSLLVKIVNGVTKQGGKHSWLDSNLNHAHLDYYYWLLLVFSMVNFGYFLLCCWMHGPTDVEKAPTRDGSTEEKEVQVDGMGKDL